MSEHKLLLSYRRRHELEGDEHLFDGTIGYPDSEPLVRFDGLSFEEMISKFSEVANVQQNIEARLCIVRDEVLPPGVTLLVSEGDMLRKDPLAFARALTLPPTRVVLKLGSDVGSAALPLKAGYDSLAAAFGDHVYARVRPWPSPVVECPVCGRWKAVVVDGVLTCQCDPPKLKGELTADQKWFKVATQDLLDEGRSMKRFYLPRAWNPSGSWVSYEDLKAKYEAFTKERESCFSSKADK